MASYFPIPPNIPINESFIYSSITLGGFSNNNLKKNRKFSTNYVTYVLYKLENQYWEKIKEVKCKYGNLINIKRSDIKVKNSDLLIAFSAKENNPPQRTNILPEPLSLRNDNAPIKERASYNFELNGSISSYQGDYPLGMAKVNKGTFFCTDSLINKSENNNKSSYLMLLNINQNANKNDEHVLYAFDPYDKKVIKKFNIKSNAINLINLNSLVKFKKKELFFQCKTSLFTSIFINTFLDKDINEINVEHTHPPSQYFWGNSASKGVKLLKGKWLNFL